jgi:transposase
MSKRRSFDKNFKDKVALEALRGEKTLAELSSQYDVHANMINNCKKQLLENLPELFEDKSTKAGKKKEEMENTDELYRQIGRLQVENQYLKKSQSKWSCYEKAAR